MKNITVIKRMCCRERNVVECKCGCECDICLDMFDDYQTTTLGE